MQVPTLPSLLAFASRTIRRSGPDLPASIRGKREGTTGGQFGLDGLNACGRNVLQLHITHFMTANSLYTDAYYKLIVNFSLFFLAPTLNVNLFIFLIWRAQKSFSREDSQVVHKGRLLHRVYAP